MSASDSNSFFTRLYNIMFRHFKFQYYNILKLIYSNCSSLDMNITIIDFRLLGMICV